MLTTTTWLHTFTNYSNLNNINSSAHQILKIFQPVDTKKIRLQLNNLYDEVPLRISHLEISNSHQNKASITLNGKTEFAIEPRLVQWSDWIDFNSVANEFLTIKITSPTQTIHSLGMTISNDLIQTEVQGPDSKYFYGVSGIQVQTETHHKRLAFFGDSLTNQGNFSAPLAFNLENQFHIMTANYGISGNRILHPGHSTSQWSKSFGEAGLTRFDHMLVDYQPDIVIFMEGINDLLHPGTGSPIEELPTADAIIKALTILKNKCLRHGITFIPMTITPAWGNINDSLPAWNEQKENLRLAINQAILKMPHSIDLASLTSNEENHLRNIFDCEDHVHFLISGGFIVAHYIQEQLIRRKII